MIFIKDKRRINVEIFKGDYILEYFCSDDEKEKFILFKKDECLHRDDDKPAVICLYNDFLMKSKSYYHKRVQTRLTNKIPKFLYGKSENKIY